ncbi:DUF4333 domain-containing protein [Subtercola boreus]|uniref:DUF4333 domain-containing protein n=1 Tax=Subtercola boreus TaxID=120213 RepID=A0A3E0WBA6_9MICO|nr:DUF4333 domain-containing protein [Subtercola boreus]RFA20288.1 hypothetical protein B7R24_09780 [Subtercola boreus]RFA20440.1 hypothetical protein B7R23_09715 [Subtercola boreus]RFA26692.1 hypothetical protein B7R25_09845 [Subtercola boreus]
MSTNFSHSGRPLGARSLLAAVLAAILLGGTLAGCSFQIGGPPTISAEKFASQVADAVVDQLKVPRPIVTCGTADIEVVEGKVVHCDFSATDDPTTVYDSQTTISQVQGTDFHIETQIDDTPKGG